MAIPEFWKTMLPLLEMIKDGRVYKTSELYIKLGDIFNLTDDEKTEKSSIGKQNKFYNRINWGITYLSKASLIERTGRGLFIITDRGQKTLGEKPDFIDHKYLMKFPEFREFQHKTKAKSEDQSDKIDDLTADIVPEEMIETGYNTYKEKLSEELLKQIMECPPEFFESLVVDLLVAMGYGGNRKDAGSATKLHNDGGVDGLIKEDKLGLDIVYIQAKRWQNSIGRPEIQSFAGSLEGFKSNKGVFITTSKFTNDANDYVRNIGKKIILIDGAMLADLMIEHKVGVTEVNTYTICKIDLDYFEIG